MEIIILGGIGLAALLFNVALRLLFHQAPWDSWSQGQAYTFVLRLAVVGVPIALIWFGPAAMLAAWPAWLALAGSTGAAFAVGAWAARRNERKAAPRQTLDARLTELEQRGPLPPWAAGIRQRETARPKGGAVSRWLDRL